MCGSHSSFPFLLKWSRTPSPLWLMSSCLAALCPHHWRPACLPLGACAEVAASPSSPSCRPYSFLRWFRIFIASAHVFCLYVSFLPRSSRNPPLYSGPLLPVLVAPLLLPLLCLTCLSTLTVVCGTLPLARGRLCVANCSSPLGGIPLKVSPPFLFSTVNILWSPLVTPP